MRIIADIIIIAIIIYIVRKNSSSKSNEKNLQLKSNTEYKKTNINTPPKQPAEKIDPGFDDDYESFEDEAIRLHSGAWHDKENTPAKSSMPAAETSDYSEIYGEISEPEEPDQNAPEDNEDDERQAWLEEEEDDEEKRKQAEADEYDELLDDMIALDLDIESQQIMEQEINESDND